MGTEITINGTAGSPHDDTAERATLGAMLRENETIADVREVVTAAHFYVFQHQLIFRAISDLADKGVGADLVSVCELLRSRNQLAELGEQAYAKIGELWEASPTSANAVYYARIVKRLAVQRFLIQVHTEHLARAAGPCEDPRQLAAIAEKAIGELAQEEASTCIISMPDCLALATDWIDRRAQGVPLDGVQAGIKDLDAKTGGFHDGELTVIAARPSVGKTALAGAIVRHVAGGGYPVFFASLEQSATELGMRWLTTEAGVDGDHLRKGTVGAADLARLIEVRDSLEKCKLFLDHTPGQSVSRIIAQARRLKKSENVRLVVVDYLQLIDMDRHKGQSRAEQVADVSRRLKLLARELRVPVIALAQLNRQVESRGEEKPKLSDLRDSGAIEQDADCVLLLWRPEGRESNVVQILVEKQRNGSTGPVTVIFERWCGRFQNYSEDPRR